MPIRLDKVQATRLLEELLTTTSETNVDKHWVQKVERLSALCNDTAKTHIAFLGVSMLARALDPDVDLYYIKPKHAPDEKKSISYSARPICHDVLVPFAVKNGIDLGATGREPLNNQPYFRMKYIGDGTAVHISSKPAWNHMLEQLAILQGSDCRTATKALKAFLYVRMKLRPKYVGLAGAAILHPLKLADAIKKLVDENSENGKRAQAAVSAIMDTVYGKEAVDVGSGRINDPSRKRPGDVSVVESGDPSSFEKAFEVKDKCVTESDVLLFAKNSSDKFALQNLGYVAVANSQPILDQRLIQEWSIKHGICLMVYTDWENLILDAFFWCGGDWDKHAELLRERVRARLIDIEASEGSVQLWNSITSI